MNKLIRNQLTRLAKYEMKLNLPLIAVILSIIATVVGLSQPIYSFMTKTETDSGEPSFSLSTPGRNFLLDYTYSRIYVYNNGTATAHNVKVWLIYTAAALSNWDATEFLPQLQKSEYEIIEIPIGYYHLNSTTSVHANIFR